jgi:hypothetical protein
MSIIERVENLDRRIIFLLTLSAVVIPLLLPIGFKIDISEPVQMFYDAVDALPPGSLVLVSCDYDPSTMPELYPMNEALARHCFKKHLKIVGMGLWPQGIPLNQASMEQAALEYHKVYGVDYINLGYKAGGIVVISAAAENIPRTFPLDYAGHPIEEFEIMKGIKNFDPFSLIVSLSAGDPGVIHWVMIAQGRYGKNVVGGVTAVSAPSFYPYLDAGQLNGLIGGMKGAAEYETLLHTGGTASRGMDAQSITHGLIICFIIFANVFYIIGKRRKK